MYMWQVRVTSLRKEEVLLLGLAKRRQGQARDGQVSFAYLYKAEKYWVSLYLYYE